MVNERSRRVTSALARTLPRGVVTRTQSRLAMPFSAAKLGAHLDEELRLQLGEPRVPAAHRAREVVLGEAVGRDDDREAAVAGRGQRVVVALQYL